ncbi:MAG TPA: aminoglycoside phosphotransferase family protein [Anaerolineae bacterium]|nr:aminoglycoside phosphotransferase family protein [Anaerolineae bacterium]
MIHQFHTKRRHLWQPSALRLLREAACARAARRSVPAVIDGVRIHFPEIKVSCGLEVTVRSTRLSGQPLLEMLYQEGLRETALDMGLIGLRALEFADLGSAPGGLFGRIYPAIRPLKVMMGEMSRSGLLTPRQRRTLGSLVLAQLLAPCTQRVLVHGDLHPSHLIVDLASRTLGIIDLEAMRTGKAATNFAQLWIGYYFADEELGREFRRRYFLASAMVIDERFDADVRAELALRSYSHVIEGMRQSNREMEEKARALLSSVLTSRSFDEICPEGAA